MFDWSNESLGYRGEEVGRILRGYSTNCRFGCDQS